MNIFVLDRNPEIAAQQQCDKHVVKMILESAQMLCTAHRELDGDHCDRLGFYRSTHKNHPCAKWVRESMHNYRWLWIHMMALGEEYTYRYGKEHLTIKKLGKLLERLPHNIPRTMMTEFPQCMPDEYKSNNTVEAYQSYYINEKANIATWNKNRAQPEWFNA